MNGTFCLAIRVPRLCKRCVRWYLAVHFHTVTRSAQPGEARSTGSHWGGTTMGWLASASLLVTLGLVMCGTEAAQKAAATPMRTSARRLEASLFMADDHSGGGSGG